MSDTTVTWLSLLWIACCLSAWLGFRLAKADERKNWRSYTVLDDPQHHWTSTLGSKNRVDVRWEE